LAKLKKNTSDQHRSVMVCMTLNCVGLTQSSVIWIIHRNVGLKRFSHLPNFFVIIISFCLHFYFTK